MAGDRRMRIIDQLFPRTDADLGRTRLCEVCAEVTGLTGAGIMLMSGEVPQGSAGSSNDVSAQIEELQFTLGEGPCVDAWAGGQPVLEPDLADPTVVRWPAFAQAGVDAGVLAVFAFPLALGAIRIGVLVLYRDRTGVLSADGLAYGLVLADVATHMVLGLQAGAPVDSLHELLAKEPPHWAEIHQATGMVSVQLEAPLDEAFVRLRAHAFAEGLPLREVAGDVVAGHLRLEGSA